MGKSHQIESKTKTLSEAVGKVTERLDSNLATVADLQHRLLVLTTADEDLTTSSFDPVAGSADEKVRDAVDVHRAAAGLLDQASSLMAALAQGADGDELDKRHAMFEAAADRLKGLDPSDASDLETSEKEADAGTEAAHVTDPKTAGKAKLEAIGEKAFGTLGVVAKVAGTHNKVGGLSALIYGVGEHVEKAVALKKGQASLTDLAPKIKPEFEDLLDVLKKGGPMFSDAVEEMVDRAVKWSDEHRPAVDDPARLSYDLHLAGMITDARKVRASITRNGKGLGQVEPAFEELLGLLAGSADEDGSSHELRRAVGGELHAISRIRKAL